MNYLQFAKALLDNGYAESTSQSYYKAIFKVERSLGTAVYGASKDSILNTISKLDKGGQHEELGNKSHRTVVNAVKAYNELYEGSKEDLQEQIEDIIEDLPEVEIPEEATDLDLLGDEWKTTYKKWLKLMRNYTGYNYDIGTFIPHFEGSYDDKIEYYMLLSIRDARNNEAHDPTLTTLNEEELCVVKIGILYMKIINNRLNIYS